MQIPMLDPGDDPQVADAAAGEVSRRLPLNPIQIPQIAPFQSAGPQPVKTVQAQSPQSTETFRPNWEPIPQLQQYSVPRPPQQQFTPSYDVFKDPMIVLAGLSSLFTRQPLMNAMKYATGAMEGFHKGQEDVFKQQDANFKQALDAAVEQNRVELTRYNAVWKNKEETEWRKSAPALWAQAVANKDQLMQAALQSGRWELVEKILLGRETADNAFAKAFQQQEARDEAQQAQIDRWTKDPGIVDRVKQIRNLDAPPPPQSSRNPQNQAIWQLLASPDPDTVKTYSTTDFTKQAGALQILSKPTSSNQGGRAIALNASTRHLEELEKLIDALNLGNLKIANDVSINLRRQNGYPEITNYEIGADIASKEVVKAIVPGGGSMAERNAMETSLAADHGPKALHGAVDTLRGFLSKQYGALHDWATDMGPKVESTLNRMVGPAAKLGEGEDPDAAFRANAKAAGYSDKEIDEFLAKKGR